MKKRGKFKEIIWKATVIIVSLSMILAMVLPFLSG